MTELIGPLSAPGILPYGDRGAFACYPYDPRSPLVAQILAEIIQAEAPRIAIEHVGSTAIPGCPGKGFIDLLVLPPDSGGIPKACHLLSVLGFQSHDFGQSCPGFRGGIVHDETFFRIHVQVVPRDSEKHREMVAFRDLLRSQPALAVEYGEYKRRLIQRGMTQNPQYTAAKSECIRKLSALAERSDRSLGEKDEAVEVERVDDRGDHINPY